MRVSFFLTRPLAKDETSSDRETSIYARLCYAGYKFKYYLPESINPRYWNKETRRAKETQKFREYPEFNSRLNHFETTIKNVYRKFINDNNGTTPLPDTLKGLLNKEIRKQELITEAKKTFLGFFKEIIDKSKNGVRLNVKSGKPMTLGTNKVYQTAYNHLLSFQNTRKQPLGFESIDLVFYCDYTEYLMKKVKLSTNTIGKHIQVIKMVMNEATETGVNKSLFYKSRRFASLKEKVDAIYLTEAELKDMADLDLRDVKRLDKVRDLFLIGCYTGLRYSDFSILKPENIQNGFIEITQLKTGDPVVIPVHLTVKKIMEKYEGALPPSISNQKTNSFLKEIGKLMLSLNTDIIKTFTKGGHKVIKSYKKWELLSTHTARRSFASNEYLAGTPAITIMTITGHRSEKVFLSYLKLSPNEHAKLLEKHWNERNALKAI